ncbi:MAG TPA: ATP-binding protein, partial [Dissulfurispiraceae bacterium]|nr:ATP-binding protein [Dissulfurispiraceae bacterium]
FSAVCLFSGIYVIITVASATSTMDNLIKLHQVEILREHLLIEIKKVQADLSLQNTRHSRGIGPVEADVRNMENVASVCTMCHHSPDVLQRLKKMQEKVGLFREAMSKVLKLNADEQIQRAEEDNAFSIGEDLVNDVSGMIALTSANLEEKTSANLWKIKSTKLLLFMLVGIGPFVVIGFGFILMKSLTKPVNTLLEATRRIREGALDYKIVGLTDEFGEVAESFNDMAHALKEHMRRIAESEKQYRMLFESAADAIFLLEAEGPDSGRIIAANRAAAEMHGYTVDELLTLNIRDLDAPVVGEGDKGRLSKGRILKGEWIKVELNHRRKDGTLFPVEVSAGLLVLAADKKYILVFDRDISERKQAERLLQRTEQLKMCGELAAGLAHEIKNPLAGIKASMELLFKDLNVHEPDRTILLKAIEDTVRIESFMKEMLKFARPPAPQFTMVDVNAIIDSTVAFALRHPSFSSNGKVVTIKKDLSEQMPKTMADPLKLQQVFLNLFLNAADAMPEGGTITLQTVYDVPSNTIWITVSDTGKGFAGTEMSKIFEPFFTTKPKGTGLGLPIVKRLVEQHGGSVSVESSPGKGTSIIMSMPVRESGEGKTA